MTEIQNDNQDQTIGRQLAWFGAGFVLPFYSLDFYLAAVRKPLRRALLFFVALMTLISALTTTRLSLIFDQLREQTIAAVQSDTFPEIIIKEGIATVTGETPFVLSANNGYFIAVDTGGELTDSELIRENRGILLAETELRMYNSGRYERVPLQDYNTRLNIETIKIDGPVLEQFFTLFSVTYLFVSGIGIWFWNVPLWLLFLVITTYFLWSPIGQVIKEVTFRSVLIIGIYAHLPAFIINYVLHLFEVQIVFSYTILLMVFWIGAIYLVLRELAVLAIKAQKEKRSSPDTPDPALTSPRLWPAVLGLPLIVFMIFNAVNNWEFAPLYILGGLALTITGLLLIDSIQYPQVKEKPEL
jgi:hypothetical protein